MANTDQLDPWFWSQIQKFINDSNGLVYIISAYRDPAEQRRLWNNKLAEMGYSGNTDPDWMAQNAPDWHARVRKWVAPPGRSNHQRGYAVDLGYNSGGRAWAHENAHRYGLSFPMAHEPWHIEPAGLRDGTWEPGEAPDEEAYTYPPDGFEPAEEVDPHDPGVLLKRFSEFLNGAVGGDPFGSKGLDPFTKRNLAFGQKNRGLVGAGAGDEVDPFAPGSSSLEGQQPEPEPDDEVMPDG